MIKVDLMPNGGCSRCRRDFVIYQPYSGLYLCRNHLGEDIEKKARRSMRKFQWINAGDTLGILFHPDPESAALLNFLSHLTHERRDIPLMVLLPPMEPLERKISLLLSHRCGCTPLDLSEMSWEKAGRNHGRDYSDLPHICGIDRVVIPDTLEQVAPRIFQAILGIPEEDHGDPGLLPRPGGPVAMPFMTVRHEEVLAYAENPRFDIPWKPTVSPGRSTLLDPFQERHPSTYHSLVRLWERITEQKREGVRSPDSQEMMPS